MAASAVLRAITHRPASIGHELLWTSPRKPPPVFIHPPMATSSQLASSYQTAYSPAASSTSPPPGQIRRGTTIIFLGAPACSAILRTKSPKILKDTELLDAFRDRNSSGAGGGGDLVPPPTTVTSATSEHAAWRILPLKRKRLPTGLSQKSDPHTPIIPTPESCDETSSTKYSSSSAAPASNEDLARSFAIYNVPSSPVHISTTTSVNTSLVTTTDGSFASFTSNAAPNSCVPALPPIGTLTDLRSLPNARYLTSIQPQTMSISTIVGIISISPVRNIVTRKFHKPLMLQTLLVGDETAAGFKIDIWIPLTSATPASRAFKETVDSLRLQDVILIENLALGVWNEKVNGATLGKDRTHIKLVYRLNRFGSRERRKWDNVNLQSGGEEPGLAKIRRVAEWAENFVDPGRARRDKKPREDGARKEGNGVLEDCELEEEDTQLPDDTVPSIDE
ncbi:hypothetical protein C7212DRAFT_364968 [Tuber magnatum]|uniref:Uncharacterized protein n=1 Tax=Tuber magnatum TaxID=42249 RepID=A0A317SJA2_9PEZI|nr:hypothetical protein C7212DRAFT_364968 [Tuber magnatum]